MASEKVTFKFEGLSELENRLKALDLSAKDIRGIVRPALEEAILVTYEKVDPDIPVDKGYLKQSHKISKVKRRGSQFYILDGVSSPDGDKALAQEFGNANTPAQPFLLNNFRSSIGEMVTVLKSALDQGIKAVATGGPPLRSQVSLARAAERKARRIAQATQHGPSRKTLNRARRKSK